MKNGGEGEWEFLWKQFKKSNVATEKSIMLNALGSTREIWLLQRYLEWSLNDKYIRKQDSWYAFISVANNPVGYSVAKEFFESRLNDIHKRYVYLYCCVEY